MNPIQNTMAALREKLERSTRKSKKRKPRSVGGTFTTFEVEALEQRKMLAADTVINIDTFTGLDDMTVVSLSTRALETINLSQSGLEDVIGGTRALSLTKTGGSLTASKALFMVPTEDSNGVPVDGKYSVSFGGAATDGFVVLDYGVYADAALELNQSFTTDSVIQLDLESNDLGGEFTVGLQDGAGSTAIYSVPFARGVEGVVIEFPLHEFTGIDLNDIDGIQILTDPVAEADLVVDEIRVVVPPIPESPSLVVTTAADVVDAFDNETSLREAIAFANDVSVGLSADGDADNDGNANDTITFAGGIGEAFENGGTIRLTEGEFAITAPLTIDAPNDASQRVIITGDANGDDVTDVDGITIVADSFGGTSGAADDLLDDNSRIFNVTNDTSPLTLDSLTLTGGRTTLVGQGGGAIAAGGELRLTNSTISGNSTMGDSAPGGGLFAGESMTLTDSTVSGNSTSGDYARGGGIRTSYATLTGSTVTGNSTSGVTGDGGGISAQFTATLTNTTLAGNSTSGDSADGGGVNATLVNLANSTVTANSTSGEAARGGGVLAARGGTFANSIVLGNVTLADGVANDELYNFDASPIVFDGHNLVGTDAAAFDATVDANVANADSALVFDLVVETLADVDGDGVTETPTGVDGGMLADNGGDVLTIALLASVSNPAIDTGDSAATISLDEAALASDLNGDGDTNDVLMQVNDLAFDARGVGFDRVFGDLDLGAFELNEPINDPPVAFDDNVTTDESTSLTINVLVDNGNGADSDAQNNIVPSATRLIGSAPEQGVFTNNGDGTFTFDPDGDFETLAAEELELISFTYEIEDEFGETSQAQVNIEVVGTNDAPVATADENDTTENVSVTTNVIDNDLDVDATDVLSVSTAFIDSMTLDSDGLPISIGDASVIVSGNEVTFDPGTDFDFLAAGETATVVIDYTAIDDSAVPLTNMSTLTISVTGTNDAPIVQPITATADEEGPVVVVTADFVDPDSNDSHGFSIHTTGTLGTVVNNGDGTFSYNPAGVAPGTDSFTYTVDDGNGGIITETVTITIVARVRSISIDKFTNGVDADNPEDAVAIQAGDIIDWTYVVTNTGEVAFDAAEVIVTDDNGTPTITDDFSTLTGHIVLDASTDNGNDGILSAGESWTYAATGIAANINLESVTVEAEHMHRRRYRVVHGSQASGGRLVRLNNNTSNQPGKLWSYFQGESGTYDLKVTVQDENDGQSEIVVKVAGTEVGRIQLDQDTDGAGSNNGGFSEFTLEDIAIESGDEVTLWVDGDGGELVRIDKLEFVAPTVFTMAVIDDSATIDYTLEAEDMTKWNYRTRNANQASGGKIARLRRAGTDGDLTTTFDGESGSYSLTVFAQDENDGQSEMVVKVAGQEVGRIQLDQDNDGEGSDHGPFSEFTLTDIQVNQGDQITLWVDGDGGEYVRIDKLELSRPFVLNSIQSIASVTAGGSTSAVDSSNYVNQTTMSMSGESHFGYWCTDEVEIYEDGYGDFADLYRFYDANGDLLVTANRSNANFGWDSSVGAWELEWNASQIGFDAEQVFFVSAQNFGEVESGLLQIDRIEFS